MKILVTGVFLAALVAGAAVSQPARGPTPNRVILGFDGAGVITGVSTVGRNGQITSWRPSPNPGATSGGAFDCPADQRLVCYEDPPNAQSICYCTTAARLPRGTPQTIVNNTHSF